MKKESEDLETPFASLFRDHSLDLTLRKPNSSIRSFGLQEEGIPTTFQSSSRLRKAPGDQLVRGPSERGQNFVKPDEFGEDLQTVNELLQSYDREHAHYLEERITQQMQLFLRRITTNRDQIGPDLSKHPLLHLFSSVMKGLMMNELEIVIFSIFLQRFKWFAAAQVVAKNFQGDEATKKIQETLFIVGFVTKQATCDPQAIRKLELSINRTIRKFPAKYTEFMETQTRNAKLKGTELDIRLDIQEVNRVWNVLSRPLNPKDDANVIDFNYEVDNILQISPPYHSEQHNEDDKAGKQNIDIYGKNGAYYPPQLQAEEGPKRRGRPPKGAGLGKRKKKEEESDEEDQEYKAPSQDYYPQGRQSGAYKTRFGRVQKQPKQYTQQFYENEEMQNKRMNAMYQKRMNEEDIHEKPEEAYLAGTQFPCKQGPYQVVNYQFPGGPQYPHYMTQQYPPPPPYEPKKREEQQSSGPSFFRGDSMFQPPKNFDRGEEQQGIFKLSSGGGPFQAVSPSKGYGAFLDAQHREEKSSEGRSLNFRRDEHELDKSLPQMQRNFSSLTNPDL